MSWTEFAVTVSTGALEAVANFIHEAGAGGVVIQHLAKQRSTVTAYFPVGEETDMFLAGLKDFMSTLSDLQIEARPQVSTLVVAEKDWGEEWKRHYKPFNVGNIYITPSWIPHQLEPGQIVIELDPGMAFGTGTHQTTQMCISEIASILKPGNTMLDLGAGSGILSIVAAKLGASSVDAVDYDRVAVRIAKENALRNNCAINSYQGDAFAAFRDSHHHLVVANIGYNACARLARNYCEQGKDCILVLSGFPRERLAEMKAEINNSDVRTRIMEDWACLVLGS